MSETTRLLLISSSRSGVGGYLDHCIAEMTTMLGGVDRLLFVPYALHDLDAYTSTVRDRFAREGVQVTSIHESTDPVEAVTASDAFFVGGGNTFRLLDTLYRHGLIGPIRERVRAGAVYMGTSAGSNIAGRSIQTTNDMPIVQPPSFDALAVVPFNINPHYVDRDPDAGHHGETRQQRIGEFHEVSDIVVVGLPEATMLRRVGPQLDVLGDAPARIFRRAHDPVLVPPGDRVDWLLQ